jgi:hypothetical protein
MIVLIVLAILVGLAVSCAPGPEAARHTVADYRADASLRREVFSQCLNDPGGLGQTPDCVNAREAERLESRGSLRDQAPVGLDPKRNQ